jgi:hypothetical protein
MLGGLGLTFGLWIIYAIFFAIFLSRYFAEQHARENNRVRAISFVLFINIIALTVNFPAIVV